MKLLGEVYAAEVYGALSKRPWGAIFQTRSKKIKTLREQGLVREAEGRLGQGPFAVTIKGWELTDLGRIVYCMSCEDSPSGDKDA